MWETQLEETLNSRITQNTRLSGGDFADSRCVRLSDARQLFVKTHSQPPPYFFTTEAQGLTWLRDTNTVAIPEVLTVSDDPPCLALSWIEEGARSHAGESKFGWQLAKLHQSDFPTFGRPDKRNTGSLGVPNTPYDSWCEFYRHCRLLPLLDLCEKRGVLSERSRNKLGTVCDRLESFAPPAEPPALVHGDLWAGNRIVDRSGQSWLIDPAAHGNHREFDLAMMRLFGGYGDSCFHAYDEAFPLAPDWEGRVPLFQLAPLIVHAIKFGGGYAASIDRALSRYVDD